MLQTERSTRAKTSKGIAFHKPTLTKNELKSVMESLIQDEITYGQVVQNFEKEMASAFDFAKALSVQSLQSAYHLAFMSLQIEAGDEVLLPDNAPLAVLDAIGQLGAVPVPVDVDRENYHPAPAQIIEKINPKTKAVLIYYPYGSFRDYQPLYDYINEQKLKSVAVLEDISYIAGMEYNGNYVGSQGKIALVGLHQDMLMTIGKGAVLLTDSAKLYAMIKDLRYQGGTRPYRVRFDYTIADYQAAMALDQLSLLTSGLERRRKMGSIYREAVAQSSLQTWFYAPEIDCYTKFPVISEKPFEQTQRYFSSLNIEVHPTFEQAPLHQLIGLADADFPNSTRLYQRGVLLPLYPYLTRGHIDRISSAIRAFV